jgi:HK97 family phage prohead protease
MADWDTSYVNDLPDSAFLLILPGGRKDAGGKTVPRDLRKFPVRNAGGSVDLPHLRNALARIEQASTLSAAQRESAMAAAKALAKKTPVSGDVGEYAGTAGSGRSNVSEADMQFRAYDVPVVFRSDGDGRTLIGRAVPYGVRAAIPGTDDHERFMPGAFARQLDGGREIYGQVKMYDSHTARMQGQQPIGKTADLVDMLDGLHGAWPMYQTTRASDALELVRSGEVTGLSIGFRPIHSARGPDGAIERRAAHLDHVVLTTEPVYGGPQGARVLATRDGRPLAGYLTAQRQLHAVRDRLGLPL